MTSSSELKPPIVLIGHSRSGTAFIRTVFGLHPDIVTWSEPRTVWRYADPGRESDRFDASDATDSVRRYIRRRFLRYQKRHQNRIVMEKTPSNVLRIPYVRAIFPEARLIYVIRHPLFQLLSAERAWQVMIPLWRIRDRIRDTPISQLHFYLGTFLRDLYVKRIKREKYLPSWGLRYPGMDRDLEQLSIWEVMAKQWAVSVEVLENDFASLDPSTILRISYEDILTDPVRTFSRMCRHGNVEITESMRRKLPEMVRPPTPPDWGAIEPEILQKCLTILAPGMKRYGYAVPPEALKTLRPVASGLAGNFGT